MVVDGEVMRGTRFSVRLSPLKINFFFPAGADYSQNFRLFSPLCERTVNFYEIARNFFEVGLIFCFKTFIIILVVGTQFY